MFETETIGNATLYRADCFDVLPHLQGVDAVVTDPPYGMGYNTDSTRFSGGSIDRGKGRRDRKIPNDDKDFDPSPWLKFPEVVLWGANHFATRLPVGTSLVWLKREPKNRGTFLSDAEIGWQSGGHGVYVFNAPDSNARRRLEFTGSAFGKETAHPSQKPIALMSWCLQRVSGSSILDPFMGSGTTGVAAFKLNKKFIGIELDKKYFDIACERISRAQKNGDLLVASNC